MELTVNGKATIIDAAEPLDIATLLTTLSVAQPEYVTVEVNGEILEREQFAAITVKSGDIVEFLYFMGGGN
jgi:sulfur carrier protein